MKAATVQEIKQELGYLSPKQLQEICLRLVKYKKENKELVGYLLFQVHNEQAYIEQVCESINSMFTEINTSHVYFAKKSLRKILRIANKQIKFTASKEVEVAILLHFCEQLQISGLAKPTNQVIYKLLQTQFAKVAKLIALLHEDLQFDYTRKLQLLIHQNN
ncbi:MAG: hypothetical protein ACOVNY_10390 [Chitinophagaceae bacterium]